MPCNCGCNQVRNFGFNSLCNDCEPNAANINLCDCAGYGVNKNQCDCACPPATEPIGCGCGCDCGCDCKKKPYYPSHECPGTPFNPIEELTKRAARCVVDRIAAVVDQEIETARTQFTNECVRQALGTTAKRTHECEKDGRKACHQCGCQRHYECCCPCPCPPPCPCPCPVCDYEELIRQTVQAVANEMTEDLFKAVNKIAEEYDCLIKNLQTPFGLAPVQVAPIATNQGACCVINPNTGCGACPTAGKSSNATTWGRCV